MNNQVYKVPQYRPVLSAKEAWIAKQVGKPVTYKQHNLILSIHEERNLPAPDYMDKIDRAEASRIIDKLLANK